MPLEPEYMDLYYPTLLDYEGMFEYQAQPEMGRELYTWPTNEWPPQTSGVTYDLPPEYPR